MNFSASKRLCTTVLLLVPAIVLVLSYVYLSFEHQKLNLLFQTIHENEKYTMLETLFYFDHFVREIVISVFMSFSIAISFYMYSPLIKSKDLLMQRVLKGSFLLALFVLVIAFTGAVLKNGFTSTWLDFLQFRTTDTLCSYGSHFHFHLLHILFIMVFAIAISSLYRGLTRRASNSLNPLSLQMVLLWLVLFVLLTCVFIPSLKPFTDIRYLAHQLREIVTHATITVPISFALLVFCEDKLVGVNSKIKKTNISFISRGFAFLISSLLVPVVIFISLYEKNVLEVAQKQSSILDLFASHSFEHFIDYGFVAILSLFLFVLFVYVLNGKKSSATSL